MTDPKHASWMIVRDGYAERPAEERVIFCDAGLHEAELLLARVPLHDGETAYLVRIETTRRMSQTETQKTTFGSLLPE